MKSNIKLKLFSGFTCLSILFFAPEVYATCSLNSGFKSLDISMAVGRVVVRPGDEVGKVLRKATFTISPNSSTATCDFRGGNMDAILSQSYPLSPTGSNVYSTNISGIGIRLYREADDASNFSGYYPYSRSLSSGSYRLGTGYFVVEIVKTANTTGSGTLVPGQYSSYFIRGNSNKPFLTSTVYGNAITIASSSCEIQGNINKVITLPTVKKSDFKGVGSIAGEQAFDINILCNGGQNQTGYEENNKISLSFDYTAETNSNNQAINNDAPTNTRAKGVATQLVWNEQNKNQVIAKNDKFAIGTLKSNQTIQYNVPLKARYYQTATAITPGTVRGMAMVTVEYD